MKYCTLYYVSIMFDYLHVHVQTCMCGKFLILYIIVFCNVFEHTNPMTMYTMDNNMSLVDYIWLYIHDIACAMLSVRYSVIPASSDDSIMHDVIHLNWGSPLNTCITMNTIVQCK